MAPSTDGPSVPPRLRILEPLACLALSGHAIAVQAVAKDGRGMLITLAATILFLLGLAGLIGRRSTTATTTRGLAVLLLGFLLQAAHVDRGGYFLMWFFLLVAVYPLVLPDRLGRLVPIATPVAYLGLLPLHAVDGSTGIVVLRALSLGLIGVFVHRAAVAYRSTAQQLAASEAKAQESLATLQKALLPPDVVSEPHVRTAARYRAAGVNDRIGGDWYDTISLPSGGVALVIGDVEGHDLVAASVMGLVRGAVRSYALEGHPPSIVLERVSAFLFSAGIERLISMAYIQLYPDDTIATVALAGHPEPLVVPPGGLPPFSLPCAPGPILGVERLARWNERTVQLPRDSLLILYTDGLVDFPQARPDELDQLLRRAGEVATRSPEAVADALITAAPNYDDAAVLVVRVTSSRTTSMQRTFPALPISATVARTWISDLVGLWATSGTADTTAADRLNVAQLLLTELVSNAVRHTDEAVRVGVRLVGQRLRVEVADTSERMPILRCPEVTADEGRGLRLVDTLSSAWGAQLNEHEKIVWFELDLSGTTELDEEKLLATFAPTEDAPAQP